MNNNVPSPFPKNVPGIGLYVFEDFRISGFFVVFYCLCMALGSYKLLQQSFKWSHRTKF